MVSIKLSHVIFLFCIIIQISLCKRRIEGADVVANKIYAIYIVSTAEELKFYWSCGGALITEWYIVTSATCVFNKENLYAVAGYKKFVSGNNLDNDDCTKSKKKKIVATAVTPEFQAKDTENRSSFDKWGTNEMAVAKVESKYDFKDETYLKYCSYIPGKINVNYNKKYEKPDTDVIALGWGHTKKYFKVKPTTADHNQIFMHFAPLAIVPKEICKKAYKSYNDNINKYMICVYGVGNLDDQGHEVNDTITKVDGCITEEQKKLGLRGKSCKDVKKEQPPEYYYETDDGGREGAERYAETDVSAEKTTTTVIKSKITRRFGMAVIKRDDFKESDYNNYTRRFTLDSVGICENDHGGPLVTWVGNSEVLIGIATSFILINLPSGLTCKGPYLFTSTQSNGYFLYNFIANKRSI